MIGHNDYSATLPSLRAATLLAVKSIPGRAFQITFAISNDFSITCGEPILHLLSVERCRSIKSKPDRVECIGEPLREGS